MQSNAYKSADIDHSARVPPGKSPLRSEFTPVLNSLPDHSGTVAPTLPAATEPASPSSPMCAMPSPPSPLSLTHSQENCPPGDHHSHKPQPCQEHMSPPVPCGSFAAAPLDKPCAADVEHNDQQQRPPLPAIFDTTTADGIDPPPGEVACAAMPRAHGCVPHVMCFPPPHTDGITAISSTHAAEEAVPRTGTGHFNHLQNPSRDVARPQADEGPNAVASTSPAQPAEPWCCDKPAGEADAGARVPCHGVAPPHVLEGPARPPRINRAALIVGHVTPSAAHGALMAFGPDGPGSSCAAPPAVGSGSASPTRQQLDAAVPHGVGAAATASKGGRAVAACLELQQELDRHAMPPPKPKRARAQQPESEAQGQEKRACEAVGFWKDVWGAPRSDANRPLLFHDSGDHLPLFHPSASLPSGNPWMLSFLP